MSLHGRIALVTGGSRGIGREIAIALAKDGADVAVNYRREAAEAARVVAAITALGRRAIACQASVDSFEGCGEMVATVERELGSISILISNAGIASRCNAVLDTNPLEMARVIGVHAMAPFYLAKHILPRMRAATLWLA